MNTRSVNWLFGSLALAAAFIGPAPAVAAPVQAEIAARTVRDDVFPRSPVRFPGGVVGRPDVEYANIVGYRPLLLDLYAQEDASPKAPRPLVVWVHGGGWDRGDSRTSAAYANFPAVLASLAARGYVVASVNYRLSGEARFPAALLDVKAAIRHLRAHAADYGIDPTRVILWGGSAGGHLAALAATTCGATAFEPLRSTGRLSSSQAKALQAAPMSKESDCAQAAVIWYGIFDPASMTIPSLSTFLGCKPTECPDALTQASPIAHASASSPPMLLIHGTADTTVPADQSAEMAARLRQLGVPVQTLFIPDVDHGWLNADPAKLRDASLLALQRSFDFIDAVSASRPGAAAR